MRLQLPKKRHRQTDTPDHSSQVTMATLPPMYDNQSFETEVMHDSPTRGTPETTASLTTPSPPAKPQRSFRHKREEPETAAYLEGCDYKQDENIEGEEVAEKDGKEVKEKSYEEVMDEKENSELSFHLLEDEGIQSEADEDNCREKDGESKEERKEEAAGEQEEVKRDEEDAEQITEVKETGKCKELEQTSTESEDKRSSKNEMMKTDTAEEKMSSSAPRRSSRVIRLYQYDEDGQRYSHLPEPGCEDPEPDARLKRRSLSLTRLNTIMAAASAGPMDGKEAGGQQSEEPLHFHMEI